MGQSIYETQPCRLVELTDTRTQEANTDGYASDRVYGSYVHGIFDRHEIVEIHSGCPFTGKRHRNCSRAYPGLSCL